MVKQNHNKTMKKMLEEEVEKKKVQFVKGIQKILQKVVKN